MATARSAAMAFNRLADRDYDAPTPGPPAGTSPRAGSSVRSVALFTARLRPRPSSPRRSCSCPTAGRSTCRSRSCSGSWVTRTPSGSPAWPTSGWGSRSAWRPIAAWIALRGDLAWPPILLALAVLLWVAGFDIIYACQDVEFDRAGRPAQHPAAARRPRRAAPRGRLPRPDDRRRSSRSGWSIRWGSIYFLGVAAVAALLVYEHALVRPDDLTRVNLAFFQVNIVISIGLLVVGVVDLLLIDDCQASVSRG